MSFRSTLRALLTIGRGVTRGLPDHALGDDPIVLFSAWFDDARRSGLFLPESMAVATAAADGRPSARMMLLKGVDRGTFVFYTNHGSRKAGEMANNARVALVLHWPVLQRQIRVEGTVTRMSDEDSLAYFRTRPRGSQIGAWASRQSEELADRAELDRRVREVEERYAGQEVPLPPFWGGYRVWPERIEFWQGRANRLHDRVVYAREGDSWRHFRLYP